MLTLKNNNGRTYRNGIIETNLEGDEFLKKTVACLKVGRFEGLKKTIIDYFICIYLRSSVVK